MAASKSNLSIHAAVMNCFARCSETDTPYVCLGDFLEKLAGLEWNLDDVLAVEAALLPMLDEIKSTNRFVAVNTSLIKRQPMAQDA